MPPSVHKKSFVHSDSEPADGGHARAQKPEKPWRFAVRATSRKTQAGAAAVEFALILPMLLILLLGTIEGSLAMYDKAVITNASREGARAGIVARNPPLSDAEIRQVVQVYAQNAVVDFSPTKTLPVVTISQGSLGTNPTLIVSVSYTFQGLGLARLLGTMGQPWVMNARTVMVYE